MVVRDGTRVVVLEFVAHEAHAHARGGEGLRLRIAMAQREHVTEVAYRARRARGEPRLRGGPIGLGGSRTCSLAS